MPLPPPHPLQEDLALGGDGGALTGGSKMSGVGLGDDRMGDIRAAGDGEGGPLGMWSTDVSGSLGVGLGLGSLGGWRMLGTG